MAEHTPTPWELIEATEHHGAYVVNSYGRTVCDLYAMSNPMAASVRNGGNSFPVHFDDMAANAAFIVKAVNEHEVLVKALRAFIDHATYPVSTEINPRGYAWRGEETLDYAKGVAEAVLNAVGGSGT